MIGGSLGNAILSPYPISLIGIVIGSILLAGGLTWGAVKAALDAKEPNSRLSAALNQLALQGRHSLQTIANSSLMGLLVGGIRRAMYQPYQVTDVNEARQFAINFAKERGLPPPSFVYLYNPLTPGQFPVPGEITILWSGPEASLQLKQMYPSLLARYGNATVGLNLDLRPGGTGAIYTVKGALRAGANESLPALPHSPLYPVGPDKAPTWTQLIGSKPITIFEPKDEFYAPLLTPTEFELRN